MRAGYLILLLTLFCRVCFANMASPYGDGTKVANAFSSSNIDILSEKLSVVIDNQFKTAAYTIEYNIKTDTDGIQTPLLFYAENYKSDFKVWVDGVLINLLKIPESDTKAHNPRFKKFGDAFDAVSDTSKARQITIDWSEHTSSVYPLSDLKYFEAKLAKGQHKIRVEYIADRWVYRAHWVKEYSFNYALSPAKFWRSFGTLQINISASSFNNISTNLYKGPDHISGNTQTWNFTALPGDAFEIKYAPQISQLANALISLQPSGIALIFGVLLVCIHIGWILKFRSAHPQVKYPASVIAGSLILPALVIVIYMSSFSIIDNLIGDDASQYHGYYFLIIVTYPVIASVYWIVMRLVDLIYKRKLNKVKIV